MRDKAALGWWKGQMFGMTGRDRWCISLRCGGPEYRVYGALRTMTADPRPSGVLFEMNHEQVQVRSQTPGPSLLSSDPGTTPARHCIASAQRPRLFLADSFMHRSQHTLGKFDRFSRRSFLQPLTSTPLNSDHHEDRAVARTRDASDVAGRTPLRAAPCCEMRGRRVERRPSKAFPPPRWQICKIHSKRARSPRLLGESVNSCASFQSSNSTTKEKGEKKEKAT